MNTDYQRMYLGSLLGAVLGYDKLMTEPKTGYNINMVRNIKPQLGDLVTWSRPPGIKRGISIDDFDTLTQELYQLCQ